MANKGVNDLKTELKANEIFRNFILTESSPKEFIDYAKTYMSSLSKKEKEEIVDDIDEGSLNIYSPDIRRKRE